MSENIKLVKYIYYGFYAKALATLTKQLSREGFLLLDAGCGGERVSVNMEKAVNNAQRIAVDLLCSNLRACRRQNRASAFVLADLSNLPFKADVFDGIMCINVIEHIDDKKGVFREFSRITKKAGFFVGCTTNVLNPLLWIDTNLPSIAAPLVMKFSGEYYGHRHNRFSPLTLNKTLKESAYSVNYWIIGQPQFYYTRLIRLLQYSWLFFSMMTKRKPLIFMNEMLVWKAIRI
ncbi:MAG: class I SAM-dependent methyltransferase [Candidatus Bathyarchaeota archaeon]|nr:class I SAM-dependent methyltransferase [Candidatus Bathyarchaeota archaeon]